MDSDLTLTYSYLLCEISLERLICCESKFKVSEVLPNNPTVSFFHLPIIRGLVSIWMTRKLPLEPKMAPLFEHPEEEKKRRKRILEMNA